MDYQFIETLSKNGVYYLTLNRPNKHNALDINVVREMIHAFGVVAETSSIRMVVLSGKGPSFCAGADISFVAKAHGTTELPVFGELLQELLFEMVQCRLPVLSISKGAVYGGALGLLAASDIVISADNARFCFSETKIGMVAAAILPFINKRIGTTNTRYLMLTARVFDSREALSAGLVNKTTPEELLDQTTAALIEEMLQSSQEATIMTKQIINAIDNRNVLIDSASYSINFYEKINTSEQVKEGLRAFIEKRKPSWVPKTK